ncbi:MAG TPA: pyridoxal phosphate-dependent aminotransferase [Candidatus Polarisedimenticolaceae bacterium]|nr:pyridoxal phosphate-dependent aminotransferase [Candidatus Polarisedimenticolaceae bacterium]
MFSRRLPEDLTPNALARRRAELSAEHDLTVSNPTLCGLPYPADLLAPLADPGGLRYVPDPRGMLSAREAVAGMAGVPPERIVLTASTSEAYALLFKLLADGGDAVAHPVPSYPLIEHLARLEGLRPLPYRLDPEDGWRPEPASLSPGVRAVVAVSPNNPTGSYLERESLAALAAASPALIVDEVFRAFPLESAPGPSAVDAGPLTFTLGGLSKELGLPQLKLAWIAVSGEGRPVREAMERLAYLADQYLSVATPVQRALPALLRGARPVREAIAGRCRENLAALRELARHAPEVSVLPVGGGWTAVLRVPALLDEEALALRILDVHRVAVQPGYFFDFPREGYLVVSLLPPRASFREGCRRVLEAVSALAR